VGQAPLVPDPTADQDGPRAAHRSRRRWLLGLEPVFEGGWFHKGDRCRSWGVDERLGAVALLGDVTVDLANSRSMPSRTRIQAFAILRDVDVLVGPDTRVELSGRADNDHLRNDVVAGSGDDRLVTITGHAFLGDVTVRTVGAGS